MVVSLVAAWTVADCRNRSRPAAGKSTSIGAREVSIGVSEAAAGTAERVSGVRRPRRPRRRRAADGAATATSCSRRRSHAAAGSLSRRGCQCAAAMIRTGCSGVRAMTRPSTSRQRRAGRAGTKAQRSVPGHGVGDGEQAGEPHEDGAVGQALPGKLEFQRARVLAGRRELGDRGPATACSAWRTRCSRAGRPRRGG